MRRFAFLFVLVVCAAAPVRGIDTRPAGNRICVVTAPASSYEEHAVSAAVRSRIERSLRRRGFAARQSEATIEELSRGEVADDYYVEIAPLDASSQSIGSVGMGLPHVAVDLAILVSRVAAEMRVYDAETLQLVDRHTLARSKVSVVPASVDGYTYHAAVWLALPFVESMRYRAAVREVADEAVRRIEAISGFRR